MNHVLPDVPLAVVIAHFLALIVLFAPPVVRWFRRWQLKRQLADNLSPVSTYRSRALRQLGSAVLPPGSPLKTR